MNRSNFLKPITQIRRYEIRCWYWLCSLCIIILLGCAIISSFQGYLYYTLIQQQKTLHYHSAQTDLTAQQQACKQEHTDLQKDLDMLSTYKKNPKNPLFIFSDVHAACRGMTIEKLSIMPHQLKITALCAAITQVTPCLNHLNTLSSLAHIILTSLHTHDDHLELSLTGTITTLRHQK